MKRLSFMLVALCMALSISAQFESAPAFPGAEGFARLTTTGGRGGKVIHVTNLQDNASGSSVVQGSLRWACEQAGTRTIVFDVSGTIYLKQTLQLKGDNVSILGQTAPGDGICIADYPFQISCRNVILRYLRFRLGNRNVAYHEGDGLGGMDSENIIVDHCSVSWSVDECLSVYGSKNISIQWNIVDQSMVNSGHSKGAHGYGGNWGGSGASYHHNLLAFHTSRCPRLGPRPGTQADERMDLRNCVMYNWAGNGCYGGEGMNVNIVNNYYKPGPGTGSSVGHRIAGPGIRTWSYCLENTDSIKNRYNRAAGTSITTSQISYKTVDGVDCMVIAGTTYPINKLNQTITVNGSQVTVLNSWGRMLHTWGHFYVNGNYNSSYSNVTNDNWTYGFKNQIDANGNDGTFTSVTADTIRATEPLDYGYITTQSAQVAYEKVLAYAGASFSRDSHDTYITNDVKNGNATYTSSGLSKGFVNNQNDAGGWPVLNSTEAPLDSDGDGMPDVWEMTHFLNPKDANDGNYYTLDKVRKYYTNLEVYCNSLVESMIKAQNADADTTAAGYFQEYYPVLSDTMVNMTKITLDTELYKADKKYGSVNAVSYEPENATMDLNCITYASDNSEVVQVLNTKSGDFIVVGAGTANIIATAQDSARVSATAKVIVPAKGDANCDGNVSMADANLVVDNATATEIFSDPADANSDGVINNVDAGLIMNHFLTDADLTAGQPIKWDPLYAADVVNVVNQYGENNGEKNFFFAAPTSTAKKVPLNTGTLGIVTSIKDSVATTVASASSYPNVGFMTDNVKNATTGALAYDAYQGHFLCLNLGTDGWVEFTTPKIPTGKYKVVLHYLADSTFGTTFKTNGTDVNFLLDGSNAFTANMLKGLTFSRSNLYQNISTDLWDSVEFAETATHTMRVTFVDALASTNSKYHMYMDYIEFLPVE